MAAGFNVAEKNLEDLEKEVTCAICQEHYTDPKILPCLHYYCKECILRLAIRSGKDKPFSCPECRKNTTLPEGGVEELKSAFIINRLKSMYFKHKKTLSKQAQCEMCKSEPPAEAFCKQCDKFACKNCAQLHTELVAFFDGHEIVPMNKLHEVKTEELVRKNPAPKKKCHVHEKTLKIFCFDCSKLICRDCTVKDHKDHNIEFNNVAAGNMKKELVENLKPLREVEHSLSRALDKVHNTEREVEGQGDSVANTIKSSFEKLHAILDTRKQQLLEDARKRVREKIENLKGQEKNLSIASAGVRSVIDYTEQCVRHGSDEEVMSMHIEICRRIQEEIEGHSKPENSLEPVEEADIRVEASCAEDLQQLCQKVKVYTIFEKKGKSFKEKSEKETEDPSQIERDVYSMVDKKPKGSKKKSEKKNEVPLYSVVDKSSNAQEGLVYADIAVQSSSRSSRSRPPPSGVTQLNASEAVVYGTHESHVPIYQDPSQIEHDVYSMVDKKPKGSKKKSEKKNEVPLYSVVDKSSNAQEGLVYTEVSVQSSSRSSRSRPPPPPGVTQLDPNEPVVYSTVETPQKWKWHY